jgi:tRNA dimethylallyltransferase
MEFDAVLIAGPTASGKSAAALELAEVTAGVVINADSMQVYREAPILTAQPTAAERARAPHLLYGHVSARQAYSVGRWRDDAANALAEAAALGRMPIFVGGTGLYFTVLTDGLADIPQTPDEVRDQARALLDDIGVEALHARLMERDPLTASRLHPRDPQRVVRAYEVFESTGRSLADWQNRPAEPVLKGARLACFVLNPPREARRARIAQRFETMLDAGGLEEARVLDGLDPALPASKLLGLRPLQALARGTLTRTEALDGAITATRQFSKRQMTWFRHRMPHYIWIDPCISNLITQFRHISA